MLMSQVTADSVEHRPLQLVEASGLELEEPFQFLSGSMSGADTSGH